MNSYEWISFIKENFASEDLDDETLQALLKYLIDLELLIPSENDFLCWRGLVSDLEKEEQISLIQSDLSKASQSRPGFALPFFIGLDAVELPTLESLIENKEKKARSKIIPKPERASDLSNLQIVKKVGKQLEPFIQAEKVIVGRLMGGHTTKADAKLLFHYMFGKMGSRAQPRKWEQLSRKRHR